MDLSPGSLSRLRDREVQRHLQRKLIELARGRRHHLSGVRVASGVKITGPGTYAFEPSSRIRTGCRIWVGPGATLTVGAGSFLGVRNTINVASGLTIGRGVEFSWDTQVLDTDFHQIFDAAGVAKVTSAPVIIGHHVLIGTAVLILKGVEIGDHAVIAAGSVVTRNVEAGSIVAGNPARHIGFASSWR